MATVCFIHSLNGPEWREAVLDRTLARLQGHGLLDIVDAVHINNIGLPIDPRRYPHPRLELTNASADPGLFEQCTLARVREFAREHPGSRILYLHTKGASHPKASPFLPGIVDWTDFMLHCNVAKARACLAMLDHVDVVGCDYRSAFHSRGVNPAHFSGNFWWGRADYLATLDPPAGETRYAAEFWLFGKSPTFVDIHKCPFGHYENRYPEAMYAAEVDDRCDRILRMLRNPEKRVRYGHEDNFIDVTDACLRDGCLVAPAGNAECDRVFGDPGVGVLKHLRVDDVAYHDTDDVRVPVGGQSGRSTSSRQTSSSGTRHNQASRSSTP